MYLEIHLTKAVRVFHEKCRTDVKVELRKCVCTFSLIVTYISIALNLSIKMDKEIK